MIFESLIVNGIVGVVFIAVLVISAEHLVKRLIRIAHSLHLSGTFMGMTVLSIATSIPEIGSHFIASLGILTGRLDYKISSSTVLGANIGSDVVQQTFVLGLVIFLMGSVTFSKNFLKRNYSVMILTTLMCLILGWDGTYSRLDGAILFGAFIYYMYYLYSKESEEHVEDHHEKSEYILKDSVFALILMSLLLVSSAVVLQIVEVIVHETGIGGSLIGVLSLGIAAALPELFTAISGIRQGSKGISLGTLIGSNITNPLVAIGGGALLSTYFVPRPLVLWDLPMETITAALLLVWLSFNHRKLGRWGAAYLMCLYFAYAVIRIMYFSVD